MWEMPVGYNIDKEHQLVMSTAYGVVTREDILCYQRRLVADPNFSPNFSQLADFTRVAKFEIDPTDIVLLAARTVFAPAARRALIVSDDKAVELARIFEILRDSNGKHGLRIFRDVEEGFDWIFPYGTQSFVFLGNREKERVTQKRL
jgi:hypothetical protein